ncbi:hypothetical protein CVT25_006488 [Psilocybe cyanescens]|uniref:UBC core domain-containing protein n=1 Tax=Psilocybe cyanescens TaxID=93625 RepID=A0A409XEC4_PSICY|nr:hypothetical protein CVT25_006488 [Psilocybe cyanescens]
MTALNKNNSAVKRIMQEARELANDPCTDYSAGPLEDDIFEWHCTLRGPAGTEFDGGLYHFRILLPAEYPFRPPSIMILTPNGRFELNTKGSDSGLDHEELWQPAWGVRTAILGLQGFFPLKGQAAVGVGSIEYPASERKRLAALSREWSCPHCNKTNLELLPDPPASTSNNKPAADAADVRPATVTTANIVAFSEVQPATNATVAPLPEQAHGSNDADQTTITELPLTVAQQDDMRAMAQALHDKLDKLQSREALRETETLRNLSSRPQHTHIVRSVPISSDSPRTVSSISTPASPMPIHVRATQRSTHKPPMLLDTAICILLVLLFAIICRRMV